MYNRLYRFEFYDTASPEHYTLLRPNAVILCFDIDNLRSLNIAQKKWQRGVYMHYYQEEARMPVMSLGVQRDLLKEEVGMIWAQEGYRIA